MEGQGNKAIKSFADVALHVQAFPCQHVAMQQNDSVAGNGFPACTLTFCI
jgi:hypothetical protein